MPGVNGEVFAPYDWVDLMETMVRMVDDKGLFQGLSQSSEAQARIHFLSEVLRDKYRRVFVSGARGIEIPCADELLKAS